MHSLVLSVIISGLDTVKVYTVMETFYHWRCVNEQVTDFQIVWNVIVTMDTINSVEVNEKKIFTHSDVNSFSTTITFVPLVPRNDSGSTIMVDPL